jgi:hypothetical protein
LEPDLRCEGNQSRKLSALRSKKDETIMKSGGEGIQVEMIKLKVKIMYIKEKS